MTRGHRYESKYGNTAYLLKSLMDNLSDHIYFKDLDSKFILMNEAASRWQRNCPPSEMVGKPDFDVFSHEHAELARERTLALFTQHLAS